MHWIKENWFKLAVATLVLFFVANYGFSQYLDGKKYNMQLFKDSVNFCSEMADRSGTEWRSTYLICQKYILAHKLTFFLFNTDKRLQKEAARESFYWKCYSTEWSKNNQWGDDKEQRISKDCAKQADAKFVN